jgi:pyruvate dehydrogenase E2 component (dihydrolipoyllysine-residue acetyltransferase)
VAGADGLTMRDLAARTRRLAERAREGTIAPRELDGGTFTVSNLGMYGMTAITPIINAGQAAILGVGALRPRARVRAGGLVEEQLLTLRLTCDHRILYGADAASFLDDIRRGLEQPLTLLA